MNNSDLKLLLSISSINNSCLSGTNSPLQYLLKWLMISFIMAEKMGILREHEIIGFQSHKAPSLSHPTMGNMVVGTWTRWELKTDINSVEEKSYYERTYWRFLDIDLCFQPLYQFVLATFHVGGVCYQVNQVWKTSDILIKDIQNLY